MRSNALPGDSGWTGATSLPRLDGSPRADTSMSSRMEGDVELEVHNDPAPAVALGPPDNEEFSDASGGDEERENAQSKRSGNSIQQPDAALYGATQHYSDRNTVLCGGRVVFGPQVHQLVFTICLMTFPLVFSTVFFRHRLPVVLHCVAWIGYVLAMISLVYCGTRDPGIVPRRMCEENDCDIKPRIVLPDGRKVMLRYCYACHIYRGPRTHHCGVCNNCVDQFDHHCPWTGTCIGAHNYRPFLWFLHSLNLSSALMVVNATVATWNESELNNRTVFAAFGELNWAPVVIYVYIFLTMNTVTGLLLFHWFLIVHNVTTAEHLKSIYDAQNYPNPWDKGTVKNVTMKFQGHLDPYMFSKYYRYRLVQAIRAENEQQDDLDATEESDEERPEDSVPQEA